MNILPLAAYQKIYCDYFRFEQWEKAQPYTYNFDYYSGGNILTEYTNDPVGLLRRIICLLFVMQIIPVICLGYLTVFSVRIGCYGEYFL